MKKFFLFAVALCATLSLHAERIDLKRYTKESDWEVMEATKNGASTAKKLIYDVAADAEAVVMLADMENIEFYYTNSSNKEKAFTIALGDYFEFAGKNGILTLYDVKVGSTITLYVAGKSDKGDSSFEDPSEEPSFPDGAIATSPVVLPKKASGEYTWTTVTYEATSSEVSIKEFQYGYRIQYIDVTFNDATSLDQLPASKAVKVIENGQLVIIRDGVRYNALGAKL